MESLAKPPVPSRENTVTCPTCGADQDWTETCRRCQCDLELLSHVFAKSCGHRQRCLWHLRSGDFQRALEEARAFHLLRPSLQSKRILATCHLLLENWRAAVSLATIDEGNTDHR